MDQKEARELLIKADIFYDDEEDELVLNMNDIWAWGCADCEKVTNEELPELADLFRKYGLCGVLYWVSKKRGGMRSEFLDNNRFIDFVAHEEQLVKDIPDFDDRAYEKISYTLG